MQRTQNSRVRKHVCSILFFGLFLAIAVLTGCGSGGNDDNAVIGPVLTGNFVDGPVAGLAYSTPSLEGITDADGAFQYRPGETVIFSAGEIVLGSVKGKEMITPVDLVSNPEGMANVKAVNISRFLQLVDVDGNHANGIEITADIRALLTWNPANGTNDGSIFQDEASIFTTGTFTAFVDSVLTTLNGASVFTAATPRSRATRSASGARRNLDTTLSAASPHPFSPAVREVGIGVTNLNVSMPFYQDVMGLQFAGFEGRDDRVEVSYEDNRATHKHKVVLMQFDDAGINCVNRPVKLVFAVSKGSCAAYYSAITAGHPERQFVPCAVTLGRTVGMAKDPDGYLIELVQLPDAMPYDLPGAYLSGIGLGAASLQRMDDFYTRVLGMRFNYYLYVAGFMNEVIMQSPQSPSYDVSTGLDVVLMDYFNDTGKDYSNLPVKVVFTVADPAALIQAVRQEGLTILQTPSAGVRGIAQDPGGAEVEFAQP